MFSAKSRISRDPGKKKILHKKKRTILCEVRVTDKMTPGGS